MDDLVLWMMCVLILMQFIALGRTDGSLQLLDHTGVILVDRAFYALVSEC